MRRLCSLKNALDFLNGDLGRGIHTSRLSSPPGPDSGGEKTSTRRKGFRLDSLGQATGTCPVHENTRNIPGGNCKICGEPCRSEPGQIMPEPGREADTPTQHASRSTPTSQCSDPPPDSQEDLDPRLQAQILGSLNGGERAPAAKPFSKSTVRLARTSGFSPQTRTLLNQLHERLGNPPRPDGTGASKTVPARARAGRPAQQTGPAAGRIPLPRRPAALPSAMRVSG
jgi:hypothetical protein